MRGIETINVFPCRLESEMTQLFFFGLICTETAKTFAILNIYTRNITFDVFLNGTLPLLYTDSLIRDLHDIFIV